MVNYSKGKIYKIIDNTNNNVYIGSTVQSLATRISQHRYDYFAFLETGTKMMTSFQILKNGNYDIVLIEKFPCENKEELHARERFHIENHNCVNKVIPTRTKREYSLMNGLNQVECECGLTSLKKHLVRHRKSHMHIELMKSKTT
jgi:hypothetical protein